MLTEKYYKGAIRASFIILFSLAISVSLMFDLFFNQILILTLVLFLITILLLIPLPLKDIKKAPYKRIDERTTSFSRMELIESSDRFISYYKEHPDHLIVDTKIKNLPGLLNEGTLYYNKNDFNLANKLFLLVENYHRKVYHTGQTISLDKEFDLKSFFSKTDVTQWAITRIEPWHIYLSGGRKERYGVEYADEFPFAIVMSTPMESSVMREAPRSPVVVESAKRYLSLAITATQLVEEISKRGYSARAHIDGNYRVVVPFLAESAGLGRIGRMGLAMTKNDGPRVKFAVVTTDFPLPITKKVKYLPTERFCAICNKCARRCPGQAIDKRIIKDYNQVVDWTVNADKCFAYWNKAGTDCGKCLAVCPYSRTEGVFHKMVCRWLLINRYFAKIALWCDKLFYA